MQLYSNPFGLVPVEVLGVLYSYINEKDQNTFSQIDKTIFIMSHKLIHSIRLFPHYSGSNKDATPETLVNIIKRSPNAQKLTLGPKSSSPSTGCEGFSESEKKLLKFMITFFKKNKNQPFRRIELHEMKTSPEFHGILIESLKLSNVTSVAFRTFSQPSALSSVSIQSILCRDMHLKKFKWIQKEYSTVKSSFSEKIAICISFEEQIHLISAKFRHLHIHDGTIQSLLNCKDLETLLLEQCYFKDSTLKNLFINKHPWTRLKHVDISSIPILSDNELDIVTKQLSNLTTLHCSLKHVSAEGFKSLKNNCPKLNALKLSYPTAKDLELEYLTQNFPGLEMLSFEGGNITEKGIEALATCSNLRVLKIGNLKNLENLCIQALSKSLQQLEVLEINHVDILNLSGIPSLITNLQNLIYLQIRNGDNIKTQNYLVDLRMQYPKLLKDPPNRKIQQFLS